MRSFHLYKNDTRTKEQIKQDKWITDNLNKYGILICYVDSNDSISDKKFNQLVKVFESVKKYHEALEEAERYILNFQEPPKELGDKLILVKDILEKEDLSI